MESKEFASLEKNSDQPEIKAYRRRWVILSIFIFYAAVNSFQWIEYSIMTNIIMRYYNVSAVTVDWTSIVYMAMYAPFIIPGSYIIDKKGLRVAALIGGLGTALGTTIKVLSIGRDMFFVVLIGQTIVATSQIVILCLPPRIAAVWFKPKEVSTACALGVFGSQLGCAVGFVLPPMIVHNHENPENIGADLRILCWILTILITVGAVAVVFYFPKEPPKPPSITQLKERNSEEQFTLSGFFISLKRLLKNKSFVIHLTAYGISIGVMSAIGTLLNQLVLQYFPGCQEDAGRMGLVMVVVGCISSIITGIILDKTHKYKEATVFTFFMSAVGVFAFIFALELRSKALAYAGIAVLGSFSNANMLAGFEFAMEITFPSPESTTTGMLIAPSQILGVFFTLFAGQLNSSIGAFWSLTSQAVLLALGTVITCFIPNMRLRQDAYEANHSKLVEMQPLKLNNKQ